MVLIRTLQVSTRPWMPGADGLAEAFRHILDGMKEAGVTLLLSGVRYAVCVLAGRQPPDPADAEAD